MFIPYSTSRKTPHHKRMEFAKIFLRHASRIRDMFNDSMEEGFQYGMHLNLHRVMPYYQATKVNEGYRTILSDT